MCRSSPRGPIAAALLAGLLAAAGASAQPEDPAQAGPHPTRSETLRAPRPSGRDSRLVVYLPVGAARPLATVLLIHGWAGPTFVYDEAAEHLASRGYAVALFEQVFSLSLDFEEWVAGAGLSLDALQSANAEPDSALFGELDLERLAAVGHSYGAITSLALSVVDARVKTVVLWAPGAGPWDNFPTDVAARASVPCLVLASQYDRIAPPDEIAESVWDQLTQPERLYLEIANAGHLNYIDFTVDWIRFDGFRPRRLIGADEQHAITRRYTNAWLDRFLLGRPDPSGYTDGRAAASDPRLSRVQTP